MLAFALRRLALFPLMLACVYGLAVLLIMAAPGDGLESAARDLPPEVLAQKRIAFNYDQPWLVRYFWTWPKRLVWDQDLPAHQYEDWTVVEILRAALPVSLQVGVLALGLAIAIGVSVGVVAAANRNTWVDHLAVGLGVIGISLPTFVIGAGLLMVVGLWLRAAPVGGWGQASQAILPAVALALPSAAFIARLTRSSMLDALDEDYVRTARAKGVAGWRVLFEHALRNAFVPVLGYLGPTAASIFTGSFVVERIFAVPGMGTHVVESINNRDQSMILATVLVYAAFLALMNLLVDLLYAAVDPRIRALGTQR